MYHHVSILNGAHKPTNITRGRKHHIATGQTQWKTANRPDRLTLHFFRTIQNAFQTRGAYFQGQIIKKSRETRWMDILKTVGFAILETH